MKLIGGSKIDVENPDEYSYLNPIWEILNNVPEKGITTKELFEKTGLDEKIANQLVQEFMHVFQKKLLNMMKNPIALFKMANDKFFERNLANSWVFDKMMLLSTRVNTGDDNPMDDNPYMENWKNKWIENRGM